MWELWNSQKKWDSSKSNGKNNNQSIKEKNGQNTGFNAFLLGNTDTEYDCQFVEGVSDFWTNSKDLSKY